MIRKFWKVGNCSSLVIYAQVKKHIFELMKERKNWAQTRNCLVLNWTLLHCCISLHRRHKSMVEIKRLRRCTKASSRCLKPMTFAMLGVHDSNKWFFTTLPKLETMSSFCYISKEKTLFRLFMQLQQTRFEWFRSDSKAQRWRLMTSRVHEEMLQNQNRWHLTSMEPRNGTSMKFSTTKKESGIISGRARW